MCAHTSIFLQNVNMVKILKCKDIKIRVCKKVKLEKYKYSQQINKSVKYKSRSRQNEIFKNSEKPGRLYGGNAPK